MMEFWEETEKILKFDKEKTIFIDDTPKILRTAQNFGIRYLLLKVRANSKKEEEPVDGFQILRDFKELLTLS